ncbi:WbuC family cupin fold metalloprotein [Sphingomonas sp. R-74633]|uniref:WbuC family cupin fold metalloprotein n=1 Tax=Sphingomonas sp. R-74633 TaxID=2751188 RepID=UPI0015D2D128|nr:WbuC family cupin fold metalloprotein [Sphingomonas sp. R-74633]NYT39239.1 WbuC family cupin fold metalloprotein [Sphingomonas sp. R-74633]
MGFAEFSPAFLDDLVARAEGAPRRRQHHNVHSTLDEPVQRLFNAICVDSYIRPHRHCADPKRELLIAVRGRFALVAFDDAGRVSDCVPFGTSAQDGAGVELDPGQWHTVIALAAGSILFEVKQGPFQPAAAKEVSFWSPAEGSEAAVRYHDLLRAEVVKRFECRTYSADSPAASGSCLSMEGGSDTSRA